MLLLTLGQRNCDGGRYVCQPGIRKFSNAEDPLPVESVTDAETLIDQLDRVVEIGDELDRAPVPPRTFLDERRRALEGLGDVLFADENPHSRFWIGPRDVAGQPMDRALVEYDDFVAGVDDGVRVGLV